MLQNKGSTAGAISEPDSEKEICSAAVAKADLRPHHYWILCFWITSRVVALTRMLSGLPCLTFEILQFLQASGSLRTFLSTALFILMSLHKANHRSLEQYKFKSKCNPSRRHRISLANHCRACYNSISGTVPANTINRWTAKPDSTPSSKTRLRQASSFNWRIMSIMTMSVR